MSVQYRLGQFNLIDRLSWSPPAPQKLASPNFLYFVKITFFGKFGVQPQYLYYLFHFQLETSKTRVRSKNDTRFVIKTKLPSIIFLWGYKNYEIKSSHLPHIFWWPQVIIYKLSWLGLTNIAIYGWSIHDLLSSQYCI